MIKKKVSVYQMRILMEVFRWKGGTEDSRVGLKVSVVDGLDELLCDLYDLLLASCGGRNTRR